MAAKVQTKTYIPGSMMDLNNGLCNGMWDLYTDNKISGSEKSQFYDTFFMWQTMDGFPGYAKEQTRQTILKQESIFRHQLQELHRLYRRQRDLMNELTMKEHYNFSMPTEASKLNNFLGHVPSQISKEMQVDLAFGRVSKSETNSIFSPPNSLKGEYTLTEFRSLSSKHNTTQRTVIDLELLPELNEDNEGKQPVETVHNLSTGKAYKLADLNEPIQMEEASSTAYLSDKKQHLSTNSNSGLWYLSKPPQQDLKGREGRIAFGDGRIEVDRLKKEQLSYNLADGKAKCHDNGFDNGVYSHQSKLFQADPKKVLEHLRKRTIFGVELCERNHKPSFDSSQSSSRDQKTSTLHHNHWLGSTYASRQIPENFQGNRLVNNSNSRLMASSTAGVRYQNGGCINSLSTCVGLSGRNSKVSASDDLEELHEKHDVMDEQKNHENLEKKLPPWLMAKSSFSCEQTNGKETTVYQMHLDSLQNHSQQFFKKAEMMKGAHNPKVETDCVMKILGVPIIDVPGNSKDIISYSHNPCAETKSFVKDNGNSNCSSDLRHHIDLNISSEEEEAPPSKLHIPDSVVKIATMEIDLEAPAVLESETEDDTPSKLPTDDVLMDGHEELVKVAAETIMSISSSEQPPQQAPALADTLLWWFAEVITSSDDVEKDSGNLNKDEESIPEGMDDFEYMTLRLQETKEGYYCYKPMILDEKDEEKGLSRKRMTRKGQGKRGRPRKDFQRDVLPGIVSLSRREVTEDLQTFEEAFTGIGVSWQSSLSKRKTAGKNGRGRRRLVALSPSSHTPSPPPVAVEQTVCREVALEEKSLSGWGKRTRRLPRQRCQNGGNQSLALKC